jgi:hypothetical protein
MKHVRAGLRQNSVPTAGALKRANLDPDGQSNRRFCSEPHIVELWPDYRRNADYGGGYRYGFTIGGITFGEEGLLCKRSLSKWLNYLGLLQMLF